jgi:hypothetical protein
VAEQIKNLSDEWLVKRWRPMMAGMYFSVCLFDFIIAPILWSLLQALNNHGHVETAWVPLTLQGAGLFHLSMGAILGISAYGRTQEKIAGVFNTGSTTEEK